MTSPPLPYVAVAESFKLPAGMNFRGTSGVAFNSKGNIFVIHRGPMPLMEFDADGHFVRGFGDGMFERSHGLRIDAQDNIWATDVGANIVYKFNPSGRLDMVLGVKGHTGEWHPFGHLRLFHEPNEAVIGPTGDVFVLQGHGKGEPRVLKFDHDATSSRPGAGRGRAVKPGCADQTDRTNVSYRSCPISPGDSPGDSSDFQINAPIAAPANGATQNNHS
jgi:hypothetical protein